MLARVAFGFEGAKVVAVLRGVIAIYYISINMWIGAEAVVKGYDAATLPRGAEGSLSSAGAGADGGGAGVSAPRLLCFAAYTVVHYLVFWRDGMETASALRNLPLLAIARFLYDRLR